MTIDRKFPLGMTMGLAAPLMLAATALVGWTPVAKADHEIRLGAALSLTGRLSTEGRLVRDGYDFVIKHINDRGGVEVDGVKHRLSIVYYDDESDPNTAAKLAEKLIVEDEIKFLLGPYSSGATFAASAVAEKHAVPMVEAHGAATTIFDRGYRYIFGTLNSVDHYSAGILEMASGLEPKPRTIALIHENALFPQLGVDAAAEHAEKFGIEVVYKEKYPTGTKDLSPMVAAVREKNPDIVLAAGYTGDMILLTRQAKEMGLDPKMMAFLLGPTLPGFVESLKQDAEYVLEPIQWSANMPWKDEVLGYTAADFARLFESEFGYKPDYHPPQSAAAVLVYYHAFQKAGFEDPQKVRDAIAATDIMTFYGPVRFNEKGQNVAKSMAVIQIQNGKPVVVSPDGSAEGKLVYPVPR